MRRYKPEEKEYLKQIIPGHSYKEIADLFNARFENKITTSHVKTFISNNKLNTGRTGRFTSGQTAWNKDKKWDEYMPVASQDKSRKTTFTQGNLPTNHREVGDERISKDGYIEVKVAMYRRQKANDCWVMKHRLIWEEANGAIPAGHNVTFKDRDRTNLSLDNLMLVSKAQNAVMSKYGLHGGKEVGRTTADLVMATTSAKKRLRKR